MAPMRKRTALRTRAERSARDPRGIYAPPATSTTAAASEEAAVHRRPDSNPPKRESSQSTFGFNHDFRLSKKDKRTVKHNVLLAKVRGAGVQKTTKQRRPAKKLKADLGGLADALPIVVAADAGEERDEHGEDEGWEGISAGSGEEEPEGMQIEGLRTVKRRRKQRTNGQGSTMPMQSLKHRPGAMKRKHKMEQGEMERFAQNMAQMVGVSSAGSSTSILESGGSEKNVNVTQQDKWAALRRFIGGTMEKDKAFSLA